VLSQNSQSRVRKRYQSDKERQARDESRDIRADIAEDPRSEEETAQTDGSEWRVMYRTTGTRQKISLNEEAEDDARDDEDRQRRITSGARSGRAAADSRERRR